MPRFSPLLLSLLLAGCPAQQPTTPPPDDGLVDGDDATPIIPAEPANKAEGDVLDATIPLVGGDSLELASLRGRPVLVEISASWELGFEEAHALYAELVAEHAQLVVIVVVADPPEASAKLDGLPPELTLAWDPAGALAAKLSVATFPTMFVIDRGGRIHTVVNGWSDEVRDALTAATAAVVADAD